MSEMLDASTMVGTISIIQKKIGKLQSNCLYQLQRLKGFGKVVTFPNPAEITRNLTNCLEIFTNLRVYDSEFKSKFNSSLSETIHEITSVTRLSTNLVDDLASSKGEGDIEAYNSIVNEYNLLLNDLARVSVALHSLQMKVIKEVIIPPDKVSF